MHLLVNEHLGHFPIWDSYNKGTLLIKSLYDQGFYCSWANMYMWNSWLGWMVEARSQPWYNSSGTIQLGSFFFFFSILLYVYVLLVYLYVYHVRVCWMPWNCVNGWLWTTMRVQEHQILLSAGPAVQSPPWFLRQELSLGLGLVSQLGWSGISNGLWCPSDVVLRLQACTAIPDFFFTWALGFTLWSCLHGVTLPAELLPQS